MAYLTGGAASRTPLLGPEFRSVQPFTRTISTKSGRGGSPVQTIGVDPAAMSALQRAIAYYKEGGGYGKGVEAALRRAETKAVASGTQGLVSAGLAGTTMIGGLGKKFQEEVGMPARARVEETRAQALANLETLKAQIIQGATEADRQRAFQRWQIESQRLRPSMMSVSPRPSLTKAALSERDTSGGSGASFGGAGSSYSDELGSYKSGFSPIAAAAQAEKRRRLA